MRKQEILAQIEALKTALVDCDCGDESPVVAGSREYFYIQGVGGVSHGYNISTGQGIDNKAGFRTRDDAAAHSKAFQTLLTLRAQTGVVPVEHGVWQYLIEARGDGSRLEVRKRRDAGVKQSRCFSPAFETESQARSAIGNVGSNAILNAMKTLSWTE